MRRGLAAALALLLWVPAGAASAEPQASLPDIEDEVMCPICGTTLEQSQSPQADRERELIRREIGQGSSKEEIKALLVAEYGPDVLAVPDDEGFDLAAWIMPLVGLALAVFLIGGFLLRRPSRRDPPTAPSVEPAEAARLSEDISRYDL